MQDCGPGSNPETLFATPCRNNDRLLNAKGIAPDIAVVNIRVDPFKIQANLEGMGAVGPDDVVAFLELVLNIMEVLLGIWTDSSDTTPYGNASIGPSLAWIKLQGGRPRICYAIEIGLSVPGPRKLSRTELIRLGENMCRSSAVKYLSGVTK